MPPGGVPERSKGAGRNPAGHSPTEVRILPPPPTAESRLTRPTVWNLHSRKFGVPSGYYVSLLIHSTVTQRYVILDLAGGPMKGAGFIADSANSALPTGSLLTTEKAIDEPDRLIREWAL